MSKETLHIWRLKMRKLGISASDRYEFSRYVITPRRTEQEVVTYAKAFIFTPEWWTEYLIVDVEEVGEVWKLEAARACAAVMERTR